MHLYYNFTYKVRTNQQHETPLNILISWKSKINKKMMIFPVCCILHVQKSHRSSFVAFVYDLSSFVGTSCHYSTHVNSRWNFIHSGDWHPKLVSHWAGAVRYQLLIQHGGNDKETFKFSVSDSLNPEYLEWSDQSGVWLHWNNHF